MLIQTRSWSVTYSIIRSRPGKPNQRKGQNEKFMNFAHFCEFWCFSLGKQARFTLNFCSGMPLRKVHELTFLWFDLPGPLLKLIRRFSDVLRANLEGAEENRTLRKHPFGRRLPRTTPSPLLWRALKKLFLLTCTRALPHTHTHPAVPAEPRNCRASFSVSKYLEKVQGARTERKI